MLEKVHIACLRCIEPGYKKAGYTFRCDSIRSQVAIIVETTIGWPGCPALLDIKSPSKVLRQFASQICRHQRQLAFV